MTDDTELLRGFAENGDEAAFAEVVRRRVDLVYSAALRQVNGDAHLAQDVTQVVFADLARKAGAVARDRVLAGWLFTSTRYAAAKLVRGERRRRARETEAELMREMLHDDGAGALDWGRVRPVLDAALADLGETDRAAVLLRFFEGRDYADVGARLGLGENAARMRVERAMEKLRAALDRRGVTSTAAALGAALTGQAVVAAPAGLAATVTGAVLAGGVTGGGAVVTFMSMTKLQLGIAGAVVALGVGGVVVQSKSNTALREELAALLGESRSVAAMTAENQRLARAAAEVSTLRQDDAELMRLSEEAAALKRQMEEAARVAAKKNEARKDIEVWDVSKIDVSPKPKYQVGPEYPHELRTAGIGGEALVDFIVDATGKVQNAHAVKSSRREFEEPALAAVSQWQFDPGQKGGRAVNTHLQVPIVFTVMEEGGAAETPAPKSSSKPAAKPKEWF